ncbi:MAG TPA: hypothetical protein VFL94_06605 [Actinomycetales bacterium]|nr:hypothetical protein [Actinomycetales bacterium]
MSIPVPLAELAETMQRYPFGYLLTVSEGERVHAVQASAAVDGDRLRVPSLGRRTLANCTERPSVTLLWPPVDEGGYSLIVDGQAEPSDGGVLVSPSRAVLHRAGVMPAPSAADAGACVSDCVEVPLS